MADESIEALKQRFTAEDFTRWFVNRTHEEAFARIGREFADNVITDPIEQVWAGYELLKLPNGIYDK